MADVVERYRIVGENAVGAAFNQILNQSRSTTQKMRAIFTTAFAGISLGSLTAVIKSAVDRADEIKTLAESFGTTTEELSRLDYIAKQSNTTLRDLTSGLTAYQKNIVLAGEDSGRARKAIAALRLDADALVKLPLPRQLAVIADAFRKIENPAERVRISAQLFGDEVGRRMIPILARGSEEMKALADEADRTGKTLTTFQAETLQRTDTAFKNLGASADAFKTRLAVGLTPVIEKIVGLLDKLASPDRSAEFKLTAFYLEKNIALFKKLGLDTTKLEQALQTTKNVMEGIGKVPPPTEFFSTTVAGATAAADAAEKLRQVINSIRESGQLNQEVPRLGDSDAENTRKINAEMEKILAANRQLRSDTVAVEGEFFKVNEAANGLMDTLKDEGARRAVGYISDAIMGLDKGARNFAKGMIDAFRRILADKAAQQLMAWFEGLGKGGGGGGGGFFGVLVSGLGSLFGGSSGAPGSTPTVPRMFKGYATGGFMSPGSFGIVGENGPELAFAGNKGATIIPFPKDRMAAPVVNVHVTTNVDARGASVELVNRLPAILEQNRRAAVEEAEVRFVEGLRRNRYRLG